MVVRWLKEEGDTFEKGELIAELEADKALMEWRASESGVLLKRLVEESATLVSATPIAIIGEPGEDAASVVADRVVSLLYSRLGPRDG